MRPIKSADVGKGKASRFAYYNMDLDHCFSFRQWGAWCRKAEVFQFQGRQALSDLDACINCGMKILFEEELKICLKMAMPDNKNYSYIVTGETNENGVVLKASSHTDFSTLEAMEDINSLPVGPLKRRVRQKKGIREILKTRLQKNLSCSGPKVKRTLTSFFPVVKWLPKYKLKEYIWGDLMSGLIVGIILIPQAIAYCLLAGLDPIYGLYTSFFSNIIYFFMGTSRHVSVGIFSLMSLMVGQVVDREVYLAGFDLNEDQKALVFNGTVDTNSTIANLDCGKECYAISIAAALTFLAGIYQVLMAVLRLGFVSVYLSAPMLDGFATGASCTILTVQAKYLLGLKIPRHQGYGTVVVTWINIFKNIHHTNFCDLITSAICIIVLLAGKEIQDRYKKHLKMPLPTELVVVGVATIVSHFADLNGQFSSSISGAIPTGFIPPKVPSIELMPRVAFDAIPLAVISFAFTVSLSEMFAKKNGYTVRPNQEMIAIGFCNIIPSFFHSFTTSAALAKTMVKDSTGCQTQVSSIVSALVVLLVLLFFAPYFYALQKCVLACIIIVSLRGALHKFKDVPKQWLESRIEATVWLVTMSATALISVELGLVIGVVFSMVCVVLQTQNPKVSLLGQIEQTTDFEDMEEYDNLLPVPKVKIFRFQAPLFYANKDYFLKSLYKATNLEPFLEKTRRRKIEKKAKGKATKKSEGDVQTNGDANVCLISNDVDFHTIILDCSCISLMDTTGVSTFKTLLKDYKEVGVNVIVACCNTTVLDSLRKGSFFGVDDKEIQRLSFHTIHSAVCLATSTTHCTVDDSSV